MPFERAAGLGVSAGSRWCVRSRWSSLGMAAPPAGWPRGGLEGGLDAGDVVGRPDRRLHGEGLPCEDPVPVAADHGRLGVDDLDLGEAEPDRPGQELAVGAEPHRRAGVAASGQDQLGHGGLVRRPGPDGDPAVAVQGGRAFGSSAPGRRSRAWTEERGVLGVEPQPGGRGRRRRG